ncbi:replicative DNA helicase [Bacillus sp. MCCB 382]|uniref:replicative DNA helicase n=1 Tax=Bacillus sp. MCCB 382 TaxID=2860197 RepID=UPI001C574676|nr:replicative DNA helicase [Bacillus sp. MCCB 382]
MNEHAEELLIGSILLDNSILHDITLSAQHFLEPVNQNIYKAIIDIKKKNIPVDVASLKDQLGNSGFAFIGGGKRLKQYKDAVPSVNAFKSYEQIILKEWKAHTSRQLLKTSLDNFNLEKVPELIKDLSKIDEEGTQEEFDLQEHLKQLQNLPFIETPKNNSGIPSGFAKIDMKTDGFQKNDLVIVGARPSMGKTAFIINLALRAAQNNAVPVIFSLEMKAEALLKRMLSCLGEINGMKLKNPYHYLDNAEKGRWSKAVGELDKLDIKIYDKPRQTIREMKAKIRKVKQEFPDRDVIVFIDYLTLIKPSKDYNGNGHAQFTEISADLQALTKDYDVPIICLAQLSRGVEQRQDKRPLMSDLRESGSIEQDADIIMMLYRDEYYNETTEDNRNILEVDIAKNRDGEVGKVELKYLKQINKIESIF